LAPSRRALLSASRFQAGDECSRRGFSRIAGKIEEIAPPS
jgi:hypothetical protein